MKNGKVEVITNDQGNRITPSYVAWTDDERLVGDAAKNQYASNPHRTVFDIKRLIGRKYNDKDVQVCGPQLTLWRKLQADLLRRVISSTSPSRSSTRAANPVSRLMLLDLTKFTPLKRFRP